MHGQDDVAILGRAGRPAEYGRLARTHADGGPNTVRAAVLKRILTIAYSQLSKTARPSYRHRGQTRLRQRRSGQRVHM